MSAHGLGWWGHLGSSCMWECGVWREARIPALRATGTQVVIESWEQWTGTQWEEPRVATQPGCIGDMVPPPGSLLCIAARGRARPRNSSRQVITCQWVGLSGDYKCPEMHGLLKGSGFLLPEVSRQSPTTTCSQFCRRHHAVGASVV